MADKKVPMFKSALRITSVVEGFRRGGTSHPVREVVHAPETFSQVQAQQILDELGSAEPKLIVRELTDGEFKAWQAAEKKSDKTTEEKKD